MTRWLIAGMLWASPVSAQVCETNCTATIGQAVEVFTESSADASGYLLRRNGVVEVAPYRIGDGVVAFQYGAGLPLGTHIFTIELIGVEETYPNTLTVTAPVVPRTLTCVTSGITYQQGALLTQTMLQRYVGSYVEARKAEGWALASTTKVKNTTTVTMTCAGR